MSLVKSYLKKVQNEKYQYKGNVNQRFFTGMIFLDEINYEKGRPENAPVYDITGLDKQNPDGFPFGQVWKKTDKNGKDFFTLTFDDNQMERPLYANGWFDDLGDECELDFKRQRKKAKNDNVSAQGDLSTQLNDSVPF